MKEIVFDWIWKSNKDNKKVCNAVATELALGEPHIRVYDSNHELLLEVDAKSDYSSGLITLPLNNSWRIYCRKHPYIFDYVDKNVNVQKSWFNLHKNN